MSADLLKKFAWAFSVHQYNYGLEINPDVHYDQIKPGVSEYKFCQDRQLSCFVSSDQINCPEVMNFVDSLKPDLYSDILKYPELICEYEDVFYNWVQPSSSHKIMGLEDFKYRAYTQGSQESFNHYIMRHRNKRFRLFYKEYFYHFDVLDALGIEWCYMHEDDLKEGDAVIISNPFSGNCREPEGFYEVLDNCDTFGIPVLLDLIHSPNSINFKMDCNRPCIEVITFSLAKTFPVQFAMCGFRLMREEPKDGMAISRREVVNNRIGAWIGTQVLKKFPMDYIQKRYMPDRDFWCKTLSLKPSPVIHLAYFDPKDEWRPFSFSPYNYQKGRVNLKLFYENPNISREILQKIENGH